MKKKTFALILVAAMAVSMTACSSAGSADASDADFPVSKTVANFYIGGSVGAGGDLNMRTLIKYLEPQMDITIVPQNVTGSRTIYNAVKNMNKEPANGYTYAYLLYPHCISEQYNPATKDNMFSIEDYYPLCNLVTDSALIAVRADDPRFADVNDLADLVEYMETSCENLLISACSIAGDDDITVHKLMLGVPEIADQLTIVNGDAVSDAVTSLLGGTLDIFTGNVGDVGTLVEDGEIKVISVFAEERSEFLPDVPTAKECGYDIINRTSRGVVVHKNTSPEICKKLQEYVETAVEDPAFLADMKEQGFEVDYMNPEEYKAWLQKEYDDFGPIAADYGWN